MTADVPLLVADYARLSHRCTDTAEIVAINQVGIPIFAKGKHQLRRRSTGHIDHRRADTAKIGVGVIEARANWSAPSNRSAGRSKIGPACKRIIASPPIQLPPVLNVLPVTTNMLVPSLATPPCPQIPPPIAVVAQRIDVRRIIDIDADDPAVIIVAVTNVPGVRHVHDPVHKSESAAFFLNPGLKSHAVVNRGRVDIHGPARRCGAGVHVQ